MARETNDAHPGIERLSALAKNLAEASPGASFSMRFPMFEQVIYVEAEYLAADDVFIAVGNNAIGPIYSDRVTPEGRMTDVVTDAVSRGLENYLRREIRRFRTPVGRIDVDRDVGETPQLDRPDE